MVGPVDEAIAISEIKEDGSLIAEGHQDNQYTNFSGAAETLMGDANDIVDEVLDQVTGVSTDFVGAAKTATNWRTYTDINFYGMIAGVVVAAGLVNNVAVGILNMLPDGGVQALGGFFTAIVGTFFIAWGNSSSSDMWKISGIVAGAGLAYQGIRTVWNSTIGKVTGFDLKSETVTKRSPSGSGHVSAGQSNYQVDTSPFTIDPAATAKDVTLAAEIASGPEAEGDFGMDVVPVNYGGGGVSAVDHDQTFMQATGSLQQRGSDAKNAFVESVMPKTTSYQPQAYYAEDTPTMIQKNAHYTAETKAGIQNVFNSYQAPTTTARRGGNTVPRRMTKNANGTTISNEMKGAIGMGSVIGQ